MDGSTAPSWAEALFHAASARGEQSRIQEELNRIVDLAPEVPQFLKAIDSPMLLRDQKMEVLRTVLGEGFSPLIINLLALLGRRMKARLLPDIARAYSHLADECCGIITAEVTTAVGIPEDLKAPLQKALESRLGIGISLQARIDPAIVGGILVTAGGRRIDATIHGGFERLRRALLDEPPSGGSSRVQA
jgi:F-type H+-transporting ATPase subunit delta